MKMTQMLPVHEANLVANSGNAAFGVDVIGMWNCHPAFTLSCLCVRNEATTGGQFTKLDRPTGLLYSYMTWPSLIWHLASKNSIAS